MKDIHIIGGKFIVDKYFNKLESILNIFNVSYNGEKNLNFIFHKSPPAYYDETDFRANAFINYEIGSSDYEREYHNNYKFLYNEYSENPYNFKIGHNVFFDIINKYRSHHYFDNNPIESNHLVILLTEVRGDDNWLSATDESNNCYIHMQDWQYLIDQAELSYIPNIFELCIINSIFQNIFHSLSNITYKNANLFTHKINNSCISDFAQNKLDFIQSIRSGKICVKCQKRFKSINNDDILYNTFSQIFKHISDQFDCMPDDKINFKYEQFLIINYEGISVGTLNNSTQIINKEKRQAFIIYLFLLKFEYVINNNKKFDNGFNINKLRNLNKKNYWFIIYKYYRFCKKLYESVQQNDTTKEVDDLFQEYFYSFNKKGIVKFDIEDKPKFKSKRYNLDNSRIDYTEENNNFNKLTHTRLAIENILRHENPLKSNIFNKTIERHKKIRVSKSYDMFTPKKIARGFWFIEFDKNKIIWDDKNGTDGWIKNLKASWDSEPNDTFNIDKQILKDSNLNK